jgi:hypothetical protein
MRTPKRVQAQESGAWPAAERNDMERLCDTSVMAAWRPIEEILTVA